MQPPAQPPGPPFGQGPPPSGPSFGQPPPGTPFGQPPPQAPFGGAPAKPKTNQLALVSVIAGALGWFAVPIAASVIAIVTGHMARNEIRKTGEEGDNLAIAGLVLGYLHLVFVCAVFAFVIAIYGGFAALFFASGAGGAGGFQ